MVVSIQRISAALTNTLSPGGDTGVSDVAALGKDALVLLQGIASGTGSDGQVLVEANFRTLEWGTMLEPGDVRDTSVLPGSRHYEFVDAKGRVECFVKTVE